MYIPASNQVADPAKAYELIDAHGFATLVTQKDGVPWASHLPILLDRHPDGSAALRGHMARANEQWRHFEAGREALCIFHGPHAYISPSWYASKIAVPTWNYATVHVYGHPVLTEKREDLLQIVEDTTSKYERSMQSPWTVDLPEAALESLLKAIVGFTLPILRMETKFKLGQNRPQEDRDGMLRMLEASPEAGARELAGFIRKQRAS
jgi:transcriptional regulator